MTVSILTEESVGPFQVKLTWSSTLSTPTYFIYRDGDLIETTQLEEKIFSVAEGEQPVIEIFDVSGATPTPGHPGRIFICWFPVTATASYRIEEFIASTWTEIDSIPDDGRGFFRFQTRFLEDVTTHNFRVTPVGTNGNDGTLFAIRWLMVRHPNIPSVAMTYDEGTAKVTVTEV